MSGDITRVEKPWGYELHWAKTDRYVGKLIHVNAGHALSLQYHNVKDETIYLHSGKLLFEIEEGGQLRKREMQPGEKPPIGLILCANKGQEQIELLQLDRSGIRVASYLTELPPRPLLQKKLYDAFRLAHANLEARLTDES